MIPRKQTLLRPFCGKKETNKKNHSPIRTQPLSLNRAALFVQAADPDVRLYIPFMLKRSIAFLDEGNFFSFFFVD